MRDFPDGLLINFYFMYDLLVVCLLGVVSSNEDGFLIGS